ncbi:hypothetical protein RRF57_009264 [Xylaria bambusicola]|uniref:Uncharacterized protein n=1 Tax=Xylaria bambusicola TaxID=326684 RepID=A0AAN7UJA9_9PEZI
MNGFYPSSFPLQRLQSFSLCIQRDIDTHEPKQSHPPRRPSFPSFLQGSIEIQEERIPTPNHSLLHLPHQRRIPSNIISKFVSRDIITRQLRQFHNAGAYIIIIIVVIFIILALITTSSRTPYRQPRFKRRYPIIQLDHLPAHLNLPAHDAQFPR